MTVTLAYRAAEQARIDTACGPAALCGPARCASPRSYSPLTPWLGSATRSDPRTSIRTGPSPWTHRIVVMILNGESVLLFACRDDRGPVYCVTEWYVPTSPQVRVFT